MSVYIIVYLHSLNNTQTDVYTEKKLFKNEKSLVNFTYNYKSGK